MILEMVRRSIGIGPAFLALAGLAAPADAQPTWTAASFDRPLATQTLKAPPSAVSAPEVICTTYDDLMIRESGTETPDPDPVMIVRKPKSSGAVACAPGPNAAGAVEPRSPRAA